jgi:Ca-activated chloride channel homolog
MENNKLKNLFDSIQIPDPDPAARKKAVQSALSEFHETKQKDTKKIKGISNVVRLIGKTLKGGSTMRKKLVFATGTAFSLLIIGMVMLPNFVSYRKAPSVPSRQAVAPAVSPVQPAAPSASQQQYTAPLAEYAQAPVDSGKKSRRFAGSAKTAARMPVPLTGGFVDSEGLPQHPDQTYVGRDRFETITPNPVKVVSEAPVSTFSVDVDTASYAFVRKSLNSGVLPQKNAVRVEEMVNYFDYDYRLPEDRSAPFRPTLAVFPCPWNPETKLLHIGIKGFDITPEDKPRSNLVFLIDVSGSMKRPDKLPLIKNAFRMLLETLDPRDSVAVVVYAGAAGTVLEPTKVSEKGKIFAVLERLSAGGSTAGGEGIRQAYALAEINFDPNGINRVILATDGDFNVGIRNPEELKGFVERKRKTGIYLSVLGFGRGNYNDALMQKLAQNGNGNAAYIDNLNEARKVLVDEASATLFPIANDVKIQVEFNPQTVAEYRLIGYETRLLRREDFNNDLVDAGDIGSGHTVTVIYEIALVNGTGRLVDDLRYGKQKTFAVPVDDGDAGPEYAFLKIRYKLPGAQNSRLIALPITAEKAYEAVDQVPGELRFSAAVAAFGHLLREDPYTKRFNYDDVIRLADKARGNDPYGYRIEFLNLVRLAKTARGLTQASPNGYAGQGD